MCDVHVHVHVHVYTCTVYCVYVCGERDLTPCLWRGHQLPVAVVVPQWLLCCSQQPGAEEWTRQTVIYMYMYILYVYTSTHTYVHTVIATHTQ